MYSTTDFRKGLKIEIDNEPYNIVDFQHVNPGKGGCRLIGEAHRIDGGSQPPASGFAPHRRGNECADAEPRPGITGVDEMRRAGPGACVRRHLDGSRQRIQQPS